jgi:hypothetical protein
MQAICAALASRTPELLSLGGCVRHHGLRTALELEPRNPRVRLIEAQCMLGSEKEAGAMLGRLQALAQDFAAAPPSVDRPDWGQAESLLWLGKLQAQAGDVIGARESLEHALVIAPDYRKAQQELLQLAKDPAERRGRSD